MNIDIFTFLWDFFNVLANLSTQLWNFINYDMQIGELNIKMYQVLGTSTILILLVFGITKKMITG